jgi:Tol biopolymer transport system component
LKDGEIWRASQEGTNPKPITQTDGAVLEFSVERSGEWITFTVQNQLGGQDIWVTNREGEEMQALVNCEQDGCSEPAWSANRNWIAYTRDVQIPDTGGYQPSQVWRVEVQTGETAPLYQEERISSHSPSFSPDGQKLASYDSTQQAIRVLDLQSYQQTIIPSSIPGTGDWSQDGQQIIFTDLLSAQLEPFVMLYIADVNTGDIISAFNKEITDTNFSQPRWMPGGEWIATSLRPVNTTANKALWLIRLDDAFGIPISDDFSAIFSAYQWDPWGEKLVYQRLQLSNSDAPASIWVWDWDTRLAQQIIEDGSRPAWLP